MRALYKILVIILLTILVFSTNQSQAQNQNIGRYYVTIRGPVGNAVRGAGGQIIHEYNTVSAITIQIPNAALQGLARNPNVISIQPDALAWAFAKPDKPPGQDKKPPNSDPPEEPTQELPWGVDRIDAEYASSTGNNVNVAVIDTGIERNHEDLSVAGGINLCTYSPLTYPFPVIPDPEAWDDDRGHGTHVAGTIAAKDNNLGVIGVAPNASLYAVKVLAYDGSGWFSDILAGIEWCIYNDIDIINMSLGGTLSGPELDDLRDICQLAYNQGILIVASAGNSGNAGNPVLYPAAIDEYVIAVAAMGYTKRGKKYIEYIPNWSTYGDQVDITAPGVNIYSTYIGNQYTTMSGTSMAAPHVTGTLALIKEAKGSIFAEIIDGYLDVPDLYNTADDLLTNGWDQYTGWGLVDAEEATTGSEEEGND